MTRLKGTHHESGPVLPKYNFQAYTCWTKRWPLPSAVDKRQGLFFLNVCWAVDVSVKTDFHEEKVKDFPRACVHRWPYSIWPYSTKSYFTVCQSPLKYIILSPENYLAGIYVGFILRWFKEERINRFCSRILGS